MSTIFARQLQPALVSIQRAAAVAHTRRQRWEAIRILISVLTAGLGVAAVFAPSNAAAVSIIGLSWAAISSAFMLPRLRRLTRNAALLQEMFDTELFGLVWNEGLAGGKVPSGDVAALGRNLRVGSKRARAITAGWYDDLGDIPHPVDVLVCQEQNVRWDLRLRRRYRLVLVTGVGLWLLAGAAVGWLLELDAVLTLLTWYVPSFAAVELALETAAVQRSIGEEKRRLAVLLNQELTQVHQSDGQHEPERVLRLARHVQDGVFVARQEAGRVPFVLYQLFRARDEEDFERRSRAQSSSAPFVD